MGKILRKSLQKKAKILEESKVLGMVETAPKHGVSYQTLKKWQNVFVISDQQV